MLLGARNREIAGRTRGNERQYGGRTRRALGSLREAEKDRNLAEENKAMSAQKKK